MKKLLFFAPLLFITQLVYAQGVGINTLKPDPSAALDIVSETKGLLIPRVGLKTLTDGKTVSKPAHSLLVYNTNENLPGGEGYYFNAGTKDAPDWKSFAINIKSKNIAFHALMSNNKTLQAQSNIPLKLPFDSQTYDLGEDYDESTGTFIAPQKGIYHFDVQMKFDYSLYSSYTNKLEIKRKRNGATAVLASMMDTDLPKSLSIDTDLEAGDEIIAEVVVITDPSNLKFPIHSLSCYFNGRCVIKL